MKESNKQYYFCSNAEGEECEFEMSGILNQNLLSARNAYRIKMDIPKEFVCS